MSIIQSIRQGNAQNTGKQIIKDRLHLSKYYTPIITPQGEPGLDFQKHKDCTLKHITSH